MTNMSYCAFENTVDDMNTCIEKLHYDYDYDLDLLRENCGEKEYNAAVRFIQLCKEVAENTYEGK